MSPPGPLFIIGTGPMIGSEIPKLFASKTFTQIALFARTTLYSSHNTPTPPHKKPPHHTPPTPPHPRPSHSRKRKNHRRSTFSNHQTLHRRRNRLPEPHQSPRTSSHRPRKTRSRSLQRR